jgi:CheY-like chemotaxis protein
MKNKFKRILLIDDDEIINFLHKKILKNADVTENIIVALNGLEALEIINESENDIEKNCLEPTLVFLDINMPIMNGWQFIEEFQKLGENLKNKFVIIVLTASLNLDDEIKVSKLNGINGFLNKPLTVEKVKKIMEENFS